MAVTLQLGINGALASPGSLTVNGGTVDISTNTDTIGAVTLVSGTIARAGWCPDQFSSQGAKRRIAPDSVAQVD